VPFQKFRSSVMIKPETFEQPYVAFGHVPYQCGDDVKDFSPPGGGVLPRGQLVWTTQSYTPRECPRSVTAFVEDIGIVSVDPHWLVRADALKP
jgi:hypothetical protein